MALKGLRLKPLRKLQLWPQKSQKTAQLFCFEKFTNMTMKTHNKNLQPGSFKMDIQDTPITLQKKLVVFLNLKGVAVALIFPQSATRIRLEPWLPWGVPSNLKGQEPSGAKWVQKSKSTLTTKIPNDKYQGFWLTIPNTYIAGNFVHRFWGSKPSSIISLWSSSRCNKNAKAYTLSQQNPLLCSGGKPKKGVAFEGILADDGWCKELNRHLIVETHLMTFE